MESHKTQIAIIGTAGRKSDYNLMNRKVFDWAVDKVEEVITTDWKLKWDQVELVSGGAAFMDHVAVTIARKHSCALLLELPASWNGGKQQFFEQAYRVGNNDAGRISNYYHKRFSEKCDLNSLMEVDDALLRENCTAVISNGFWARNTKISNADKLIALTFGSGDEPSSGGTAFTWKQFKKSSEHKLKVQLPVL